MPLSRADVTAIMPHDRSALLARLGVVEPTLLAAGTEAEVYALDAERLVKLYAAAERSEYFNTLKAFYANVQAEHVPFKLPRILDVVQHNTLVALVEERISGQPLAAILPTLDGPALRHAETLYLDTVFQIQALALRTPPQTYLLFDAAGISSTASQSFAEFYAALLQSKLDQVGRFFTAADPRFGDKADALLAAIRAAPSAPGVLVHGDFFPGNVLVNAAATQVCGVIDFGSFTLFGPYLLDVALAFGYYRMYDQQRRSIRAALLPAVLERIPAGDHAQFFQFLLANAIITANLYARAPDPRTDGHFQWAQELVAAAAYWRQALR